MNQARADYDDPGPNPDRVLEIVAYVAAGIIAPVLGASYGLMVYALLTSPL